MNVSEFIKTKGIKTIANPDKKDKSRPTLDIVDLEATKNTIADIAITDLENQYFVDKKTYDKYADYGITWTPWQAKDGSLDRQLAEKQGAFSKFSHALIQGVVGEVGLGTLQGFGNIADFVGQKILGISDDDYTNPVSETMEKWKEALNESMPIYSKPGADITNPDWGWVCQNIPSTLSTLSLLIPSTGVTKLVGRAGKALKVDKVGKRISRGWKPTTRATAKEMTNLGINAATMRTLENYQEARGVYADMYDDAAKALSNMTDEEYNKFLERNKEFIGDTDPMDKDGIAKAIAKASADTTFRLDYINILSDVINLYALRNLPFYKGSRVKPTYASRKLNRLAIEQAGKATSVADLLAYNKSLPFLTRAKHAIGDWGVTSGWAIASELSEGAEEAINYIAQMEGMNIGHVMLGMKNNSNFSQRLHDYVKSPELWESAFWGVMGGVMFQKLGSGFNRLQNRIAYSKERKAHAREDSSAETAETRPDWTEMWETTDTKRFKKELEERYIREATFTKTVKEINEDPTLSDKQKQEAIKRARIEEITDMTLKAYDTGGADMLREYVASDEAKNALAQQLNLSSELANDIQRESLNVIDKTINEYDRQVRRLDTLAQAIESRHNDPKDELSEIPLPYLQMVARSNISKTFTIESLENDIKDYRTELDQKIKDLGSSYDKDIPFEDTIKKGFLIQQLGSLEANKKWLLTQKDIIETIEGQRTLQRFDDAINTIKEMLADVSKDSVIGDMLFAIHNATLYESSDGNIAVANESGTEDYAKIAKAIENKDLKFLSQLDDRLKELSENDLDDYKLLDDNFRKTFKQTTSSPYTTLQELDPTIVDLYGDITSTETAILTMKKDLIDTQSKLELELDSIHNDLLQIRNFAIEGSVNVLKELSDKYDIDKLIANIDFYYNVGAANYGLLESKDYMDKTDVAKLVDSLHYLALHDSKNKNLRDQIIAILKAHKDNKTAQTNNPNSNTAISKPPQSPSPAPKPVAQPNTSNPQNNRSTTPINADTSQSSSKFYDIKNVSWKGQNITVLNIPNSKITNVMYNSRGDIVYYEVIDRTTKQNLFKVEAVNWNDNLCHYNKELMYKLTTENHDLLNESNLFTQNKSIIDGEATSVTVVQVDENFGIILKGNIVDKNSLNQAEKDAYNDRIRLSDEFTQSESDIDTDSSSDTLPFDTNNPTSATNTPIDPNSTSSEVPASPENQSPNVDDIYPSGLSIDEVKEEIMLDLIDYYLPYKDNLPGLLDKLRYKYQHYLKIDEHDIDGIDIQSLMDQAIDVFNTDITLSAKDEDYKFVIQKFITNYIASNKIQPVAGFYHITYNDIYKHISTTFGNVVSMTVVKQLTDTIDKTELPVIISDSEVVDLDTTKLGISQTERLKQLAPDTEFEIQFIRTRLSDIIKVDKAMESIRPGSTIDTKLNKNHIVFSVNGTTIGTLPVPRIRHTGNTITFTQVNDNWITDVSVDGNSKLRDTFVNWMTNPTNDPDIKELNEIIWKYAYQDIYAKHLKGKNREAYVKSLVNQFANNKVISTIGTKLMDKHDTDSLVNALNGIAKIWEFANRVSTQNKEASVKYWFDHVVKESFENIKNLSDDIKQSNTNKSRQFSVNVSQLPVRPVIRTPNSRLTVSEALSSEAKRNSIICACETAMEYIASGKSQPLRASAETKPGMTVIAIPAPNGAYQYVSAFPKTSASEINANSDLIGKIIPEIKKEFKSLLLNAITNYTNSDTYDSFDELSNFIKALFDKDSFIKFNVPNNKNGYLTVIRTGSYDIITLGSNKSNIFCSIRDYRSSNIGQSGNNGIQFCITGSDKKVKTFQLSRHKHNGSAIENTTINHKVIDSLVDTLFDNFAIDINFNVLKHDSNRNVKVTNLLDKNDPFTIVIGNRKFEYDSFNRFIIDNDLIECSTKLGTDGTNFSGEPVTELKVKLNIIPSEPISNTTVKDTTTKTSTNKKIKPITTIGGDILTDNTRNINREDIFAVLNDNTIQNKGFALAKLVLRDRIDENSYKILFGDNIIYNPDITKEYPDAYAWANASNRDINIKNLHIPANTTAITDKWIDYITGDKSQQEQAIRKLMHERLHEILAKNGNKEIASKLRGVFTKFKTAVESNDKYDYVKQYLYTQNVDEYYENGEINNLGLEEFLIESLTSPILRGALNDIESNTKSVTRKKSLLVDLMNLIAELFNLPTINKNSLLAEEYNILAGVSQLNKDQIISDDNKRRMINSVSEETPVEDIVEDDLTSEEIDTSDIQLDDNGDPDVFLFSRLDEIGNPYDNPNLLPEVIAEMNDIKEQAIADGRVKIINGKYECYAPNGNKSNLSFTNWLLVRTKGFKRWFGDWENDSSNASKVVDENGEPLQVYHGTYADFTVFDASKKRYNVHKKGFFFTTTEDKARTYGNNVISAFLNIRNIGISEKQKGDKLSNLRNKENAILDDTRYDGALLHTIDKEGLDTDQYVAYDSNQIKSATENDGSFSDDIRITLAAIDEYNSQIKIPDIDSFEHRFPVSSRNNISSKITNGEISITCK